MCSLAASKHKETFLAVNSRPKITEYGVWREYPLLVRIFDMGSNTAKWSDQLFSLFLVQNIIFYVTKSIYGKHNGKPKLWNGSRLVVHECSCSNSNRTFERWRHPHSSTAYHSDTSFQFKRLTFAIIINKLFKLFYKIVRLNIAYSSVGKPFLFV